MTAVPESERVREVTSAVVEAVREVARAGRVGSLVVDDLRPDEVEAIAWSGSPRHLQSVAEALQRAAKGAVEYLVIRAPTGEPVATGGVDFEDERAPGKIWQVATHPELQSLGLGTRLIHELEERVRHRGFNKAWLAVEVSNPRGHRLYERLGYVEFGRETEGWEAQREDGGLFWYETDVILMERRL